MKVYVVVKEFIDDDSGAEVIGVYSNKWTAEKDVENYKFNRKGWGWTYDLFVYERELN